MMALIAGGRCLDCGVELGGLYRWIAGVAALFPVWIDAEEIRNSTANGCSACGGQVQLTIEP